MEYKSLTGTVRIASTSGHIILVGEDFVEVPAHMEADAKAKGCISREIFDKIKASEPGGGNPPVITLTDDERAKIVAEKIKEMIDAGKADDFTQKGLPKKPVLDALCGFTTTADELKSTWERLVAESEKDKE